MAGHLMGGMLGIMAVVAGAAMLEERGTGSLRRSCLLGAVTALWLVLWFVAISLAYANSDRLAKILDTGRAPERVTMACAFLAWFVATLSARGLSVVMRWPVQSATVPAIFSSVAWTCVLLLPWLVPDGADVPITPSGIVVLTIALSVLLVPASRL